MAEIRSEFYKDCYQLFWKRERIELENNEKGIYRGSCNQIMNTMIIDAFPEDCVANLRLKLVVKIHFCFVNLGR